MTILNIRAELKKESVTREQAKEYLKQAVSQGDKSLQKDLNRYLRNTKEPVSGRDYDVIATPVFDSKNDLKTNMQTLFQSASSGEFNYKTIEISIKMLALYHGKIEDIVDDKFKVNVYLPDNNRDIKK